MSNARNRVQRSVGLGLASLALLVAGTTADGSTMEARLPQPVFPFNMRLYLTFRPGERQQVFDFTFREYSKEP